MRRYIIFSRFLGASVRPSFRLSVRPSVTPFSPSARNRTFSTTAMEWGRGSAQGRVGVGDEAKGGGGDEGW